MLEKLQFMTLMFVGDLKTRRDEKGATAVEYGLMVAGIALLVMVGVWALGGSLSGLFDGIGTTIGNVDTDPTAGP